MTSPDDILTTLEVSELTKVPEGTLRKWRHYGKEGPRSFKAGPRLVRYLRSDVDAWLSRQYAATARN